MKKELIGANAGTVWHALSNKHEKMTFGELLMVTQLSPTELSAAIGWLAREDKLFFTEEGGREYIAVYHECYY